MKLFEHIKNLLANNKKYSKDGKLLKNIIVEDALKLEPELLSILLNDQQAKKYFFSKVNDIWVFDKIKFQKFVSNKQFLPDSYTAFKNKIGLTANGEFLTEAKEVVLAWPYKDCVLEGGQTKENEKRQEIFWNETLAPDEIDRLFEPKALANFKKYDKNGVHPVKNISANDNLIIKGNNLLALHSLKKVYKGKIKLIYIDPPYNTGSDGFKYNDSFNHSTWLTFMKNRLEIARELLTDDGVILVQIDHSPTSMEESPEFGYLQVLMDEVFGRKNYVTNLIWKKKGGASNTEKNIGTITESILVYAKSLHLSLNLMAYKRRYRYNDKDGDYNLERPLKTNLGSYERKSMIYPVIDKATQKKYYPPKDKRWTIGKEEMDKLNKQGKIVFKNNELYIKKYASDYKKGEYKLFSNLLLNQGSLKVAKNELKALGFNREDFDTPKPEKLMQRLLEITTHENDIVLDYHLGSGTTAAVCHKMNRKYIGIEQMDYIESLAVERLKYVIEGEQGGISKSVKWKGGGSFIYFELAKNNLFVIEQIYRAKTKKDLLALWDNIKEKYLINYRIQLDALDFDAVESLSLDELKKLMAEIMDKNELYINFYDIESLNEDELDTLRINKQLNYNFYQ